MARVLIVDDEPAILELSSIFLSRAGHSPRAAADVDQAVAALHVEVPDVLITDLVMPGGGGLELLRQARIVAPHAKVILMTGQPSVESAAEAVRAGAFDYLPKPVGRAELVGAVQRAADFKALEDENRRWREGLAGLVAERTARLTTLLDQLVLTLTRAMESRDPYTAGHQRRVAEIAVLTGRRLGFDAHREGAVRMAALLHDLGKLQVPAEILARPTRLTSVEMSLVHEHVQASHDILAPVDFDDPIAAMVLQHHERVDGSGYPHGLKGTGILLEARVLAVADSLEAMVSHRPYRTARPIDVALNELRSTRGQYYDADCVDACVAAIEAGEWTP